jgi:hypothetical protein
MGAMLAKSGTPNLLSESLERARFNTEATLCTLAVSKIESVLVRIDCRLKW